jgi:hypothetical protein
VLLRIRLPLKSNPMGRMERMNMALDICTSLAPSRRLVVRWRTLVPIAYIVHSELRHEKKKKGGQTDRKSKMPGDKENRIAKPNCIVQMVVVYYDSGTEDYPYRDYSCGGDFDAW